jgi:metal-dependent amidase/aminoacylase/carboxypeptidase family protein
MRRRRTRASTRWWLARTSFWRCNRSVARNLDPLKAGVVTVGAFHGGTVGNVIPQKAELLGTVRALTPGVRDLLERRVTEVAQGIATAYGATARVQYVRNYPVTVNHERETDFAVKVATEIAGQGKGVADAPPIITADSRSCWRPARET